MRSLPTRRKTVGGALPDLIRIASGNPKRVLSIADRSGAELGVRGNYDEGRTKVTAPA